MLIAHGSDIHEVNEEIGLYPMAVSATLSDYRFLEKLLKLGLDPLTLFDCPFGDGITHN